MVVKLITHGAVFLIGAGAGIYWGVHNPTAAANLSDTGSAKVQQAVAQAKQDVLNQVVADQNSAGSSIPDSHKAKIQQMLQSAQQELSAAKAKVAGQWRAKMYKPAFFADDRLMTKRFTETG